MLHSLHISNYVLIDSLDTSLPEGLIIITGQTGAGKSILLGAVSLVLGAKADASVISPGADSCVVEGEFVFDEAPEGLLQIMEEQDMDWDGRSLLIRRVVAASGRSRCFVNDCPVPAAVLQSMAGYLIDIHSQHQSLALADRRFQMSVLDHYAGNMELLARSRESWKRILSLRSELAACQERLSRLREEKEYNNARFEVLDKAKIREGELEELEQLQKKLANAEEIHESLSEIRALVDASDGVSVSAALKDAVRLLSRSSKFVPELSALETRLESARLEIEDILSEVVSIDEGVPDSGDKLSEVEGRMSLIYDLFTKFGCRTEGELLERRGEYEQALFDSGALEDEAARLGAALEAAQAAHSALCAELAASRRRAAPSFASSIEQSVRFLELDSAVFFVELSDAPEGPDGADSVRFMFSSNPGVPAAEIAKCASGGEMSRIMLSLKAMMAQYTGMPTLIFDEIDTGVSGSAADKMGQMICRMGRDMQVFAITHLPQVASRGNAHFVVSKDGGHSTMRLLSDEERVQEIARLLSGSQITPEAVANAKSLLAQQAETII